MNLLSPGTNENEYAMKALMRLSLTLQEHILPYLEEVINKLTLLLNAVIKVNYNMMMCDMLKFILKIVSKNPSKPNFNHYLFETFGILIRATCLRDPVFIEKFEANLFPIFNYALQQDVTGTFICVLEIHYSFEIF